MRNRAGFTLTEIVLALSILLVVIVSLMTLTGKTVHVTATADREQFAIQLATDKSDEARAFPDYAALDTAFAKTDTGFTSWPGIKRVTQVVRTTTSSNDYKKVTVTISGPGLMSPIVRTVTVAAPE